MELTQLSDPELVQQCLARQNQSAYTILVNRYRNDIYRVVYHFLKNSEDTLDAMQEVYIKVYSSLPQLQDKSKFKPWLIKIAVNQAIDSYRQRHAMNLIIDTKEKKEQEKPDLPATKWKDNPRKITEIKDINHQISEAVSRLPKQQRIVFILRYFEEMQITEIAETVSCSEGTVKANLHHAVRSLRKMLGKPEGKGVQENGYVLSDTANVPRIPVWGIIAEQLAEIQ
ncbi:MAG: sigma-70 family RNA polymerase sigma factor [bacterium]|nr:sigma-70 family RNA polymerase sigma factor [bacterium]